MSVTKSHINSEFRDIAITEVSGNVIGANLQQLTVANVSGINLPGGFNRQVLSTDGAGNLSWQTVTISNVSSAVQGTSNIIETANSVISIGVAGTPNAMTISNTAVTMTGTVNFGNAGNVLISGAADDGMAVIGTDSGTGIQFEQAVVIPQAGYGYGRLIARGRKIFRAGSTSPQTRVLGWYRSQSIIATEININPGPSAQPKYWQKIHTNVSCIYALADTGVLYCTGNDNNGQQGTGATNVSTGVLNANTHSTIYGTGITVVDFWSYNGTNTDSTDVGACMVTVNDNGTFKTYMFGYNLSGVLGNNTPTTVNHVPTIISQFTGKRPISVGFHTNVCMVVLSDGTVWGSGFNTYGQLGIGTNLTENSLFTQATDSTTAVITNAAEVYVGYVSTTAASNYVNAFIRKTDGTVWAAGWGASNRLAQGADVADKNRFVQVKTGAATFLTNVTKIMAGLTDCMALDSSGNIWAWGLNYSGYWGNGTAPLTSSIYAAIIQTGVTDFYLAQSDKTSGSNIPRGLFILKNGRTFAAGFNTNYILGTVDISATVGTMSRVVFSEPGEYATNICTIGLLTDGGTLQTGTMFKTNTNRVYISGSLNTAGFYGGALLAASPVEITDVR